MAKKKSPGAGGQPGKGSEKRARKSAPDKRRKTSGRGAGTRSAERRAIADGERSGITAAEAKRLGRTIVPEDVMAKLLGIDGKKPFGKASADAALVPVGYTIPYWNLEGTMRKFFRVKLLDEYIPKGEKKPRKYMQPEGVPPEIYFSPLLKKPTWPKVADDPSIELWITEGEKKGDAACKIGIPCMALGGVTCYKPKDDADAPENNRDLLEDFDLIKWQNRKVKIAFDSDYATNANVRKALYALAARLAERGARVYAVRLPSEGEAA